MASRNSYGYMQPSWPKLQVHSVAHIWERFSQIAKTHTVVVTIPVHIVFEQCMQ